MWWVTENHIKIHDHWTHKLDFTVIGRLIIDYLMFLWGNLATFYLLFMCYNDNFRNSQESPGVCVTFWFCICKHKASLQKCPFLVEHCSVPWTAHLHTSVHFFIFIIFTYKHLHLGVFKAQQHMFISVLWKSKQMGFIQEFYIDHVKLFWPSLHHWKAANVDILYLHQLICPSYHPNQCFAR